MSYKTRKTINAMADERGISHQTALLIWESCDSLIEFEEALDEFEAGYGFYLID